MKFKEKQKGIVQGKISGWTMPCNLWY